VTKTREAVYDIMEDVRLGRSIDTSGAKKVVADMVDSVIRNPDALMCLNQLKNKDESPRSTVCACACWRWPSVVIWIFERGAEPARAWRVTA